MKTFKELFASAENTVEYWKEGCELLDCALAEKDKEIERLRNCVRAWKRLAQSTARRRNDA